MKRRINNKKSWPAKVGFFFLIIGIIVFISTPLKKLKEEVFQEMRLAIFQKEINENNTTINNVQTENIMDNAGGELEENPPLENESTSNKISYTYIGELSIPEIRLKRGFVSKESKYNDIKYNIAIAKEADYPDVLYGNFILMAHSGNAYISFFDKLYKLSIDSIATVSYQNKVYRYKLVKTYTQPKTGKVAIYRDPTKKTLTLITCTHEDDYNQSIYIFEEI